MKANVPKRNIKYRNPIITFDTETTNLVDYTTMKKGIKKDGTPYFEVTSTPTSIKSAFMYAAAFCFNGVVEIFRTWDDVVGYLDSLSNMCNKNERYIVWVHNLSFEFQFMKDFMKLTEVFCRKSHNVLKCVYKNIEFRDSLALSNCKLAKLAENEKLPVKKLVGDLDYSKIRHEETPLTDKEIGYIRNDVLVVYEYIKKKVKEYGSLKNIPLTSTGEVRYLFRKELGKLGLKKIHSLVEAYSAKTMELQNLLIRVYAGAYTHCNYQYINTVLWFLDCFDIASSYPFQMVSKKYPTIWYKLNEEVGHDLEYLFTKYPTNDYAIACDVTFYNIEAKHCHSIISQHKCSRLDEFPIIDNGRVVKSNILTIACNEIDLMNICEFYKFEKIAIENVHVSKKEYLPKEIVAIILKLFKMKTELKGVENEEENYMRSKARINGVYGSSVFNILDSGTYFDEETNCKYVKDEQTFEDFLKYTRNPNQYLWYSIGVWVTSYAKRQILEPIKKMSENAVYSDTDSVKGKDGYRYRKMWAHLNAKVKTEFYDAMKFHGFSPVDYTFKDKNDVEHFMGIFEEEKPYRRFKGLGSKRYLVEYYDGKMASTVAGAPKNLVNFLGKTNDEKFENFTNGFTLKECKLTHTYCEGKHLKFVKDYLGNEKVVDIRSGVCLTPADFSMNLSDEFLMFLLGSIDIEGKDIYKYFKGQRQFKK